MKCCVIVRGNPHCSNFVDTRKNISSYSLEDYKDNFNEFIMNPLKKSYSDVDIYISTNKSLTSEEKAFFNPKLVLEYKGNEKNQLIKLIEIIEAIPNILEYETVIIHRFDIAYTHPLPLNITFPDKVVALFKMSKFPKNRQWIRKRPQWCDVFFIVDKAEILHFLQMLHCHLDSKPKYHLLGHAIYKWYVFGGQADKVHFIHVGFHHMACNKFFKFVGRKWQWEISV